MTLDHAETSVEGERWRKSGKRKKMTKARKKEGRDRNNTTLSFKNNV